MEVKPSNAVLAEMINSHKELTETKLGSIVDSVDRIDKHLEIQNGNVEKLTKFKTEQKTTNKWMYGLLVLFVLPLGFLVLEFIL